MLTNNRIMQISVASNTHSLSLVALASQIDFYYAARMSSLHVLPFCYFFRAAQCLISGSFGSEIKDILPQNSVKAGAKKRKTCVFFRKAS